jgi:hypothetical protein
LFYTAPMTVQELEQALEKAKAELKAWQAHQRSSGECSHTWLDGLALRTDAILAAERALYAARGEDHAIRWEDGIALRRERPPRIYRRDGHEVTFLAVVSYVDPDWKGKIVGEEHWSYSNDGPVIRIEYSPATVRSTKPSALESHPLYDRGLEPGRMMQILHPGGQTPTPHYLMMFEDAWVEIHGVPKPPEIWAVTLDEVARRSTGTPLAL